MARWRLGRETRRVSLTSAVDCRRVGISRRSATAQSVRLRNVRAELPPSTPFYGMRINHSRFLCCAMIEASGVREPRTRYAGHATRPDRTARACALGELRGHASRTPPPRRRYQEGTTTASAASAGDKLAGPTACVPPAGVDPKSALDTRNRQNTPVIPPQTAPSGDPNVRRNNTLAINLAKRRVA